MQKHIRTLGVLALVVSAFGVGLYTGVAERISETVSAQSITYITSDKAPTGIDEGQLWRVWHLLEQQYIPTHSSSTMPTAEERLYGAIAGLTDSYGDPYTVFLPPADAKVFQEDISGAFGGVGMELGLKEGVIVVVAPLKDSPAEKAGVRSGDQVLAVDGKPTQGMTVDAAVKLIRGKQGTTVKLTFGRTGEPKPLEISIVRDIISIPVLKSYSTQDGIFVIELYSFSANSTELFRKALREYFESGNTKMILDLRGNPGGYLEAAVEMASFFLPVGEVVVSEDFKGKQPANEHRSVGYNVFQNKKLSMAILIDQGSASASEILAGALQQHGVAKLVGARTFGKGSVQQLIDIGGGAQIKITIARWLTPNGNSISEGGLTPDIKVDRTIEDVKAGKDPQKSAAVSWLVTQ
ncbi:MAG: Carboxy-terminal-processing protease [Parcubacteria group bacterium Gr01-1014_56]|nr:MAG: Carboxy-terminal-processing protease [Parcubacteria group bacterium Gr01-1014_56]